MDRHGHDGPSRGSRFKTLRNSKKMGTEINSLNIVTEAARRTVAGTTGRHKLRNPDWVEFLLNVLRGIWNILAYNYKVSG